MKTIYIFLLGMLLAFGSIAQQTPEFEFHLYFEDALGNRDTITIGYDESGTQGLDVQFEEIDITNEPWDSNFEVRVSEAIQTYSHDLPSPTHLSKKQIVKKNDCTQNCYYLGPNPPALSVHLKVLHFPFTITWEANLLQDTCVSGSHLEFDVLSSEEIIGQYQLNYNDNFSSAWELWGSGLGENPSYINSENDTIYSFWVVFCSQQSNINVDNTFKQVVYTYPNPVKNELYIEGLSDEVNKIVIYDNIGRKIHELSSEKDIHLDNSIDVNHLPKGNYHLKIITNQNELNHKFVKE